MRSLHVPPVPAWVAQLPGLSVGVYMCVDYDSLVETPPEPCDPELEKKGVLKVDDGSILDGWMDILSLNKV